MRRLAPLVLVGFCWFALIAAPVGAEDDAKKTPATKKDSATQKDSATKKERQLAPVPKYEVAFELIGHTRLVRCVAFRPGTHLLATGGSDRSLRLWNADRGFPASDHILPRSG